MADLLIASVVASQAMDQQENFLDLKKFIGGSFLFSLMIVILAGALCWNCNKGSSLLMKIIYTILAMIFGTLYLIYYVVMHVAVPMTMDTLDYKNDLYDNYLGCTN